MALAARFLTSGDPSLAWRCSRCDPDYVPPPDEAPEEELRLARNCDGDPAGGASLSFTFDAELRRCPWTALDRDAFATVRSWELWTTLGVLPYGGSMADQPEHVVEAFEICSHARRQMEAQTDAQRRAAEHRSLLGILGQRGGGG